MAVPRAVYNYVYIRDMQRFNVRSETDTSHTVCTLVSCKLPGTVLSILQLNTGSNTSNVR